jgi:hypothetical protein
MLMEKQSYSRIAHERNSVDWSVDVDVEPEVRQLSASAHWMDAIGRDSSVVKSRSHLDCVKANAPWRRRFDDCASPTKVTAKNVGVIDGLSAIAAAQNGPIFHGALVAAERRHGSEATIEDGAQVQTVCSTHRCFLKNTFVDIAQDDDGADGDTEGFDVPQRRLRSYSDSCIDYRYGTASASTDGFEQATENMEYSAVWMPWSTEGFVTVDENAENNATVSVYYQPYWFYVAGVSATAVEDDDEQLAKTTTQQFVACTGDFDSMYPLACPVVACDFSGTIAEQTCYDVEKSQIQQEPWWNPSREARDRSISMGASSVSTAASAKDFQTSNNRLANIILRNIPTGFTREMLLSLLDSEGFEACYEFVYLPCDFVSESSLGYAFVIMITSDEAKRAIAHFKGYRDWNLASNKVCETCWGREGADLQWHVERYRNSPVMHRSVQEKFRPALFRDGVQVAFPPPTRQIEAPGRVGTGKEEMHCPNTSVVMSAQTRHHKQH